MKDKLFYLETITCLIRIENHCMPLDSIKLFPRCKKKKDFKKQS